MTEEVKELIGHMCTVTDTSDARKQGKDRQGWQMRCEGMCGIGQVVDINLAY